MRPEEFQELGRTKNQTLKTSGVSVVLVLPSSCLLRFAFAMLCLFLSERNTLNPERMLAPFLLDSQRPCLTLAKHSRGDSLEVIYLLKQETVKI